VIKRDQVKDIPSLDTRDHSFFGNSYWPFRMRFFIPGEMGAP